jgi:hypothetical protein
MITPGNISIGMTFMPLYRTQIKIVATGLAEPWPSANDSEPFPAEFLHVVVARRNPTANSIGPDNEADLPADYFSELEIVECAIGFSAYNYTTMTASGNRLDMKSSRLKLEPGTRRRNRTIVYDTIGLPVFQAKEVDVSALVLLFGSSRLSGEMTSGQIPKEPPSGAVMALLKPNVSQTFDNIAASMTEQLRSANNAVAQGITISSEVFVSIQWGWITLPVFVTLTAALFLLATWLDTQLHHCIPWKSSTVAILYHQVILNENSDATIRSDIGSIAEIEDTAEKTKARLI